MKISKLIEQLEKLKEIEGDLETVMTATLLPEGFYKDKVYEDHMKNSKFDDSDVFESTIETLKVDTKNKVKRVKFYWQS